MSNDPAESGAGADDLLGRWLAHHGHASDHASDHAADDGAPASPRQVPLAARPSEAAAPVTRLSASAALAELRGEPTVDRHDGLDRVAAPSPVGFEPVILRSVRKKSEPKEDPEKKDRGTRLSRLRSRVNGPAEQPDSPEVEQPRALYAEPAAVVPPPVFKVPPPIPEPAPRKLVPYEDMVTLAATASLPVAEPEPEPEPYPEVEPVLPGPDTEPTPVIPEPEPQPEVEPVLPGPDTEPTPVVPQPEPDPQPEPGQDTIRRLLTRTKPPKATPPERKRRPLVARHAGPASTGTGGAARGLLAAARTATPAPALASQTRPAPQKLEPVPMLPVETVVEAPARSAPAMEMPAVYEFAPRRTARRFLSLMLIVGLAASGYLGYPAYLSRDPVDIGIAGIVTLATMVIWAIRAGATVTRLTVRRGQLEIVRQGGRLVFDLASHYTSIQVIGKPGSRKWKVQFLRSGMAPVVIDSTMVDGRDFMRVLTFFRPEVAARGS